jgi:hypothetical protein
MKLKLVPVEPTEAMLAAGHGSRVFVDDRVGSTYAAMIEAAPDFAGKEPGTASAELSIEDRLRYAATCPVSGIGGDLGDDLLTAAREIERLRRRLEVAECWSCRHFGRERCANHAHMDDAPPLSVEPIVCPTCSRIEGAMGERWATKLADALEGKATIKEAQA